MPQLHETKRGARFYDFDVPRIAEALERIAHNLEQQQPKDVPLEAKLAVSEHVFSHHAMQEHINEVRQHWHDKYKGHGAVPYDEAKSFINILTRLLRRAEDAEKTLKQAKP